MSLNPAETAVIGAGPAWAADVMVLSVPHTRADQYGCINAHTHTHTPTKKSYRTDFSFKANIEVGEEGIEPQTLC